MVFEPGTLILVENGPKETFIVSVAAAMRLHQTGLSLRSQDRSPY